MIVFCCQRLAGEGTYHKLLCEILFGQGLIIVFMFSVQLGPEIVHVSLYVM